jgi:hypothetical protein
MKIEIELLPPKIPYYIAARTATSGLAANTQIAIEDLTEEQAEEYLATYRAIFMKLWSELIAENQPSRE